ncbi:MAG: protein translocase subunit SecD [Parachlamydiales bacterium]|nr:protein translocase subunit SecD [Parachlamydiales bacterium]
MNRKRWQFWLIIIVIALTVYNILPTVFYYSKPLKNPISKTQAENISVNIMDRVNVLEKDSIAWLNSFCKMLNTNPKSVNIRKNNPSLVDIEFSKKSDAEKFKKYLPRAGSLIYFVPSQLTISPNQLQVDDNKITIQRKIPINFDVKKAEEYFEYTPKFNKNGNIASFYKDLSFDRAADIGNTISGVSRPAILIDNIVKDPSSVLAKDSVYLLVHNILDFTEVFNQNSPIASRYFASFTQGYFENPLKTIQTFLNTIDSLKNDIQLEKSKLKDTEGSDSAQRKYILEKRYNSLIKAESIIKKNINTFASGKKPITYQDILTILETKLKREPESKIIKVDLKNQNPIISQLILDFSNDKVFLTIHKDLIRYKDQLKKQNKELFDQLIINEIAQIANATNETILTEKDEFSINLHSLENTKSYLALKLSKIAQISKDQILYSLKNDFKAKHDELSQESFPVYTYEEYKKLPVEKKRFCLVVYAPSIDSEKTSLGMRSNSIYVIAKGLDKIIQKYQSFKDTQDAKTFLSDFEKLQILLRQNGYLGFSGKMLDSTNEFANDFIFEKEDYFATILKATREDFKVHGSNKYAVLEFTNLEQRILTLNKIETQIQEDLLKWKDDYNSAQVSIDTNVRYDFAPPTKNVLIENLSLSYRKYFRGDDRKVLHWGLDLSGGKTVAIELRDQNNRIVKNEAALKQGMNELYSRVNKMGVSEVNIRTVDSNIVLDFPGAQGLTASDLVKASSMYFNLVNEKFTSNNTQIAEHVNKFLQEVYNEAIVTNRKDIESINAIAYKHLYGESLSSDDVTPRSASARILYENGLRLASNDEREISSNINDQVSKIAIYRDSQYTKLSQQTNPLIIVFKNYALDGTSLQNIRSSYDPAKGNFLTFEVKGSYTNKEGQKINPREDLYSWTSKYSKEKIQGTEFENYSRGKGWRMAVILNDSIISSPTLDSALRDSAMISGSFTLREVNQLTADLKAGSLSFTPHILSEKNVSPELGKQERLNGIIATFVALIVVIAAMIFYYRFSGLIASIAVIFNLFIMWATLQNLHATLTLAGIAGVILTVGMAVDANVLVFERIKEEFAISGRIASAIQNGYKKAFSSIFDSNITTIIAALILLNFDSGPIKGFAVTLIIGIVSSMFTALFVTKYFFTKWAQNPNHKSLKMLDIVKVKKFNFLKFSKFIFIISGLIILVGAYTFSIQKKSVFGIDFTGGFVLNVEIAKSKDIQDYRQLVEKALLKNGISSKDFQVRTLTPNNNLRILFGTSIEQKGKPFYNMPLEIDSLDKKYRYQTNPKLVWIVDTLKKDNIELTPKSLSKLDQNFSALSGQMSEAMRNNAIFGLSLALLAILIYITFRFEFKYAMSAMICLIHDILVSVGLISLLHMMGVSIQIDMHTVAALMTIIGYSLNDTIVIFDRIREDIKHPKKLTFAELINNSLNTTLSRTTITSGTTILALLALVILGGSTIFSFALVMTIGVVFGTLSSIFIASPLMLLFHKFEIRKNLACQG